MGDALEVNRHRRMRGEIGEPVSSAGRAGDDLVWRSDAVVDIVGRAQQSDDVDIPRMRVSGPTLDARDPLALADFYCRLLGWTVARSEGPRPGNPPTDGWAMLRAPDGSMKLEVQWEPLYRPPAWPAEDGEQQMMMHLDIGVADLAAGVAWAEECGARRASHQPQDGVRVMLDPEGHPFCLFVDDRL